MKQVLGRKTVAWGTAMVFLLFTLASVFFGNPGARTAVPGSAVVRPVVPLETAIRLIRANFQIPAECASFTSGYNSSSVAQSWALQWNVPAQPGTGCSAQVDASSGEILSFNINRPSNGSGIKLGEPAVSLEQARGTASHLLDRVAVAHSAQLRPAREEINLINGPASYIFHWERVVNGIPFPANGVSVQVSAADGLVTGYYLSWLQAAFPAADRAISPEQARQVIESNGMLELQYYQPGSPRAVTVRDEPPVLLVYRLVHPSGGIIDAISGAPRANNIKIKSPNFMLSGAANVEVADAAAPALSPEEIKEVQKIAGLLSQDEAATAARKWLPVAAGLILQGADLLVEPRGDAYTWNLRFKEAAPGKTNGINARVNALTGELIEFNYLDPSSGAWPWQFGYLSRDSAWKVAGEFLKRVQPQRFQEVILAPIFNVDQISRIGYPPTQQFNYRRMVNGIPFPGNSMVVDVDAHARRLSYYELDWSNPVFPGPQGALSLQQAYDAFFRQRPLKLVYTRNDSTGGIGLIYQPQVPPGLPAADLLDAGTGDLLDYSGKAVAEQAGPHQFKDIAGSYAEKEITLLGEAGLFGEYGDAFHPEEPVTAAALLRAMLQLHEGPGNYEQMSGQEVLKQARDRGWLREDLPPDGRVARDELCRIVVRMQGLERAAEVRGIYRLPFADAAAVLPDDAGYVALAWGLGIIKEEGALLKPEQPVTRAEAAAVLFRAFR